MARERANRGISTADRRLPISVQILHGMIAAWAAPPPAAAQAMEPNELFDNTMLRAAASLYFFGFFRSGELMVLSVTAFDELFHLAWGDVAVDDSNPPAVIKIHLKRSKCDQLGNGVDIYVGRTGTDICPVTLALQYVRVRGPSPGPFFRRHDGSPLMKALFMAKVRQVLVLLGQDAQRYAGHSFRIGAATAAAQAGLEDSVIQALGRWSSSAFLRYVHTPRRRLAAYSRQLASMREPQVTGYSRE